MLFAPCYPDDVEGELVLEGVLIGGRFGEPNCNIGRTAVLSGSAYFFLFEYVKSQTEIIVFRDDIFVGNPSFLYK